MYWLSFGSHLLLVFENKANLGNLYLCRQCSCTKNEGCIRPCDSCQQLHCWKKAQKGSKKIPSKNDDTKESLVLCLVWFFESRFVETEPEAMKSLFCFLFEISFRFYVVRRQFSGNFWVKIKIPEWETLAGRAKGTSALWK